MNKNKFFYSYKYELNFLATHTDINKFNTYHYTILEYIKNNLGPKYKFRNYKISGPNFTKIEFHIKKFKNEKKTDYIKSKSTITFTIFSMKKENINFVSNKINNSYPHIMHALNSLELINYISLIDSRISVMCKNVIFLSKSDSTGVCNDIAGKMDSIRLLLSNINPNYVNSKSISKENLNDLKGIVKTSKELKSLVKENDYLIINYPLFYNEIIKLLENMDRVTPENIILKNENKFKLINLESNNNYFESSYVNKIFVYLNLFLILLTFIFFYLNNLLKR